MKIVTVAQMRRLEEACAHEGISTDTLMERAGLQVARMAQNTLGTVAARHILVLVGPGNNGGDGLVAASHLQRWGARVTAYLATRRPAKDLKLAQALNRGVIVSSTDEDTNFAILEGELNRYALIIDAVLGTGRGRPLEGSLKEVLLRLTAAREQRSSLVVMALDLPTGLNADTGAVDPACPGADVTVALGYPKLGLYLFPGASMVGRVEVVDIGIPSHLAENIDLELLTPPWVASTLPTRAINSHKGVFGHTLVIAGSRNYVGAAYLASQGAARVGPGLVTLASPQGIYPTLASKLTEVIHLPLPDDEAGMVSADGACLIKDVLANYSALAVGCGLGQSEGVTEFLQKLLLEEPPPSIPVVIDADGLNGLAKIEGWWHDLRSPTVLTPHPGELSTLTGIPTPEIQADRICAVRQWAAEWRQVVVLKGAHTLVAAPHDGSVICRVNPFANPALASGGTGDVLTGTIAGLLAQGLNPEVAAACGVYIHSAAGERVREELGDTGTLAGDLLPLLPKVIKGLRGT